MDQTLLKKLLSSDFYASNKARLRSGLFAGEARDIYDIIVKAHNRYGHDLSAQELMALYDIHHPVATRSERAAIEDLVNTIEAIPPMSDAIATDVLENMWRREIGREIANLGIEMNEGHYDAMQRLKALLERVATGYMPDDFGDPTTDDLDELLEMSGNDHRFQFNIETLSRHVYGVGAGEFMIAFATPETGKTSFCVSLMAGPGGFAEQGAKVLYLGNEEDTRRTKLRAYQAWNGWDRLQIVENNEQAKRRYLAIADRIVMKDIQDRDLDWIESYIQHINPDIVIIDQADKVQIGGSYNASHERLRELYRRLREAAKRHSCAVIGVSQASAEADGRTRLTYTMLEGSKIGKAAEADLICGVGRHSGDNESGEPDTTRFITVSKNKLSGWHGTIVCNLESEICRYVA